MTTANATTPPPARRGGVSALLGRVPRVRWQEALLPSVDRILRSWEPLSRLPGGRHVFDRLLGAAIPYTGALGAEVLELSHGYARAQLRDRHAVRNHLGSVHAVALANLAELTGNLALVPWLPADARFIVQSLQIDYLKKARGRIMAECRCVPPATNERRSIELEVLLRDRQQNTVARCTLKTLVGPR